MRTLILLTLSLAACAGETPNIHGTILDPSGWPVEGARITCANQSIYSNVEGRFTVPGDKCDAAIEKTGFKPQTAQLSAPTEAKITLAVAGPLETVVVSATRTETTPEQAAVAASVITEQRLQELGYPMLSDVFRDIPGLQVSQYGPTPGALASLYTRGSESTATLVLVDGVPLNDPGGELHLEHLTSEGIERVEAVRGPQSALFGAEADAGVIQIFTKHGDADESVPHGFVSYERGNFQTDRWIANLTGGFDGRLDYALSASGYHTVGEFQNQYDRDNTGTVNIGYKLSNSTELRGVFRVYDDHVGVPGQVAYGIDDPIPSEETRNQTVSLSLDDSRGSNFRQRFTFAFNKLRDRYNDDEPYSEQPLAALVRNVGGPVPEVYFVSLLNPLMLPAPNQIPPGLTLVTTDAYFEPSDSLNLTERKIAGYQGTLSYRGGALVFGYDYQDQTGYLSGTNASRTNNGFFANLQQSLGKRVYLSGGARLEHSSAFGTIGTGRGGASLLVLREHGPLSSLFFRLTGGRGVTEPSLLENYAQVLPYYFGNPNLRPAVTNSSEAALVAEWFGRRIRTEVSGFRNSFHNLIAFVLDTWQNVEQSYAHGVETSVQARLPKDMLIMGTYMWLDTRITSSASPESSTTGIGEELVHRPRNSGSVSFAMTPRRWSFVVGGRFEGEFQDSDFTFGVTRNPGYQFVYASASYKATKHVTPVLRVDNLLNARYEEVLGYQALSRSIIGGVRIGF